MASSFDPERDPTRRALSIRRVGEPWADEAGTGRTELESLVAGATHRWAEEPGVEPVWRPPLPERLPLGLRHGASWVVLGREDRPAERRQPDLIWDPADGHLVVLGGRGRGRTTTLRTALLALATQRPPDALEIHVVAPRGPLTELGVLPHSGAMVDLQDRLTVRRLVRRLEARSADAEAPPCAPLTILAVDGYEALAAGLDDLEGLRLLDELDHLARDGARRGIILALTSSRPSVVPASLAAATGRLVALGLDDPADYGLLGLRPRPGPLPPGRGQTAAGHEVQIGCPDLSPAEVVACHPAGAPPGQAVTRRRPPRAHRPHRAGPRSGPGPDRAAGSGPQGRHRGAAGRHPVRGRRPAPVGAERRARRCSGLSAPTGRAPGTGPATTLRFCTGLSGPGWPDPHPTCSSWTKPNGSTTPTTTS